MKKDHWSWMPNWLWFLLRPWRSARVHDDFTPLPMQNVPNGIKCYRCGELKAVAQMKIMRGEFSRCENGLIHDFYGDQAGEKEAKG